MIRFTALAAISLVLISSVPASEDSSKPMTALRSKVHGAWKGIGPCDGNLVLKADGTYEREHYSPGNNTLTGTWTIRWNALPPTLVLVCKTSDDPVYVGKTLEVKLIELNNESLIYQYQNQTPSRYTRMKK